jgi:hypothetical protein
MKRCIISMVLALSALVPTLLAAQPNATGTTTAAKIQNAQAAAPAAIAAKATIVDWPAAEGAQPVQLRAGTNGWTCYPDMPMTKGNDPMCLDAAWQQWLEALMSKQTPQLQRAGVAYMIAPGGGWGSNIDPFAMQETPDNEWGHDPPHIMLLVPDRQELAGLPTQRQKGGPWVMWANTPYAHVMVPVGKTKQ